MATVRKIELMHRVFGKDCAHLCKDCSNFVKGQYHTKTLQKCKVYGLTHSQASDWAQRYMACGMFNKQWNGNNIIELVKRGGFRQKDIGQIDGQIALQCYERKEGAGE